MSHTPGPWMIEETQQDGHKPEGRSRTVYSDASAEPVLDTYCVGYEPGASVPHIPNPDDARLIAAAPDLLDALEALVAELERYYHDGEYNAVESARAAIAKARGEA